MDDMGDPAQAGAQAGGITDAAGAEVEPAQMRFDEAAIAGGAKQDRGGNVCTHQGIEDMTSHEPGGTGEKHFHG